MEAVLIRPLRKMSSDDFFRFCRKNPGYRIERDKTGNIIFMEPTNSEAGYFNSEVTGEIREWNKQKKEGMTFDSSAGFTLPNGAVRSPDTAWILKEKWQALAPEERKKFAKLLPDFVVELRSSRDDSLAELKKKMEDYVENGVRLGWLIDRIEQKAYIYRGDGTMDELRGFDRKLSGEDVMKGFELDLALLI